MIKTHKAFSANKVKQWAFLNKITLPLFWDTLVSNVVQKVLHGFASSRKHPNVLSQIKIGNKVYLRK